MERVRATFIRFLFCFIGGADNRRRGQREEWTAGVVDSEEDNGRRGQPQWWILKRAVFTFKKVVFNKKGSYLI